MPNQYHNLGWLLITLSNYQKTRLMSKEIIHNQIDLMLFEEGRFSVTTRLLKEGYRDYQKGRNGEACYLEDHFIATIPARITDLEITHRYAKTLKLEPLFFPARIVLKKTALALVSIMKVFAIMHAPKQHNSQQIAVFGEVLMDQFPDGQQILGGAPFNVAWHLQAFGQHPCFMSRVGKDAMGETIRQAMANWGMSIESLQIDNDYPTGTVKVTINKDEPSYEILADQAYDFIDAQQLNPATQFNVIYHGTLALRNPISEHALNGLTAHHTGKIFIDVNLRTPWWHQASVNQWVGKADWVKLNRYELMQLMPAHNPLQDAMRLFLAHHELEVLIVTRGSLGALALNNTGEFFEVAPTGNLPVVDTVGAGDAFSAVLLLGIQKGWPLSVTMDRAQSFSSALVTQRGATVQDLAFYQTFIRAWKLD